MPSFALNMYRRMPLLGYSDAYSLYRTVYYFTLVITEIL